ncbi:winged helix DNA-binding domain-containing protein [Simulacricoccus sp. 17bor-14]|nr:winged helix DNA-binding domain-containing protein [Simulacricoccus sp. 17bor-14]
MSPRRAQGPAVRLSREEAARFLVGHQHLAAPDFSPGVRGVRQLLLQLRCIQLDPLDVLGTNADLVALARVEGLRKGDVYRALLPGHAFEHFAKERCLLPAYAFPYYRDRAAQAPWWRLGDREQRLPPQVVERVLHEVRERGPVSAAELTDHGSVVPIDWSGWKGTGRATAMALEVLWTRCQVVVCGREPRGKRYDVPERALPKVAGVQVAHAGNAEEAFLRWALLERVEAAGLLSRAGGAHWSMLAPVRTSGLPDALVAEGLLEEVEVEGSPRRYLAPRGFRARRHPEPDGRMRLLGPLDPLLWDRELVRCAFGFEYVWEVYKPEHQRRWGWYVCPLLHRGQLVGRLEGRVEEGALVVSRLWRERGRGFDEDALDAALARHAEALGAARVKRPRRAKG